MITPKEIFREMEIILNLDPDTMTGSENLVDVNWDSMASVMFIAMADEKFGVPIDITVLKDITTVDGLLKLLPLDK
jgi:acyl carrier protein